MNSSSPKPSRWRSATLTVSIGLIIVLLLGGETFLGSAPDAAGMTQTEAGDPAPAATPVVPAGERQSPDEAESPGDKPTEGGSEEIDPLDGDPLDGEPAARDAGAPEDQELLEVVRSGRPDDDPSSIVAYDDDLTTTWTPNADSEETWLWLDLGTAKRLRAVRWFARGSGSVEIALSSDRQRWQEVDRVDVGQGWQGIEVRDDARYVRLTLVPADEGEPPSISEATVYGRDLEKSVSAEQSTRDVADKRRKPESRGDESTSAEQKADNQDSSDKKRQKDDQSKGRVDVSTEPGETRCNGKRAKCQAREGDVSVESDCESAGTCIIDVRADGGRAICDASGGDASETRDGEEKRGGRGGRCEAVADGGTVTIGDLDP